MWYWAVKRSDAGDVDTPGGPDEFRGADDFEHGERFPMFDADDLTELEKQASHDYDIYGRGSEIAEHGKRDPSPVSSRGVVVGRGNLPRLPAADQVASSNRFAESIESDAVRIITDIYEEQAGSGDIDRQNDHHAPRESGPPDENLEISTTPR